VSRSRFAARWTFWFGARRVVARHHRMMPRQLRSDSLSAARSSQPSSRAIIYRTEVAAVRCDVRSEVSGPLRAGEQPKSILELSIWPATLPLGLQVKSRRTCTLKSLVWPTPLTLRSQMPANRAGTVGRHGVTEAARPSPSSRSTSLCGFSTARKDKGARDANAIVAPKVIIFNILLPLEMSVLHEQDMRPSLS
jgi:hypothetical protein